MGIAEYALIGFAMGMMSTWILMITTVKFFAKFVKTGSFTGPSPADAEFDMLEERGQIDAEDIS